MALADFFGRSATAAAQVLDRFEESGFRAKVKRTRVGIAFGKDAAGSPEGRVLLDLLVRLMARFYGSISFRAGPGAETCATQLARLALTINPIIDTSDRTITAQIAVGQQAPDLDGLTIYAGSDGWDALVGSRPQPMGESGIPFGAGASACIACANLFRALFVPGGRRLLDESLSLSVMNLAPPTETGNHSMAGPLTIDATLVGVGAIGNAAIWALSKLPLQGVIRLVDHQDIELSNLQRYVLADSSDVGRSKVQLAASALTSGVNVLQFQSTWAEFVEKEGSHCLRVLVALDSAKDRMAVQASLPHWVANAWTQPGDLGVSVHSPLTGNGACLNCLYLPQGTSESQDAIIANALGIPERLMQVRELLYRGTAVPIEILEAVANRFNVPSEKLLPFADRPIRELFVQGICGGAVLPLGQAGKPAQDVHVPLAHQSCLAGILLAGSLIQSIAREPDCATTLITRIDVMKPLAELNTQPALKDPRGICICQDLDFVEAYRSKYPQRGHPNMAISVPANVGASAANGDSH